MRYQDAETVKRIFDECRTIAIIGISSNPMRVSNGVATFMQEQGYRIIPVNPHESEVLGENAFTSLSAVGEKVELVDIFRRSEEAGRQLMKLLQLAQKQYGCRKT